MPQIACPFGYSKYLSTLGVSTCYLLSGLVSCSVASIVNDRYRKGEEFLKCVLAFAVIVGWSLLAFIYLSEQNDFVLLFLMVLFGTSFAAVPLCIELSVECLYPIGQGLINGCLLIACEVAQFVCGGVLFALAREMTDEEILQSWQAS